MRLKPTGRTMEFFSADDLFKHLPLVILFFFFSLPQNQSDIASFAHCQGVNAS